MTQPCSEADLQALIGAMQADGAGALRRVDTLLAAHPQDARLHFLRGSMLASMERPKEALPALRKAVELAPDFAIARFQLGFFQLTSGESGNALATWEPLRQLPESHYLRVFVEGLTHLIRDEFAETVQLLREGIALNRENPPLNHDMGLIIERVSGRI